jgi:RsiW-degrading membrane proteinase PrsW (M82 family)
MFIRVFATAMLPIVVLMYIIYKKDSMQPEPKSQLRKAFYLGVLSVFLSFLLSLRLA